MIKKEKLSRQKIDFLLSLDIGIKKEIVLADEIDNFLVFPYHLICQNWLKELIEMFHQESADNEYEKEINDLIKSYYENH